jgi:hypothetical protein
VKIRIICEFPPWRLAVTLLKPLDLADTTRSFETSVTIHQSTQHNIQEYLNLQRHRCDSFKSHKNSCSRVQFFKRARKIAKSDCYLRHICQSVRLCAWNNSAPSAPTGGLTMKFHIRAFLKKSVEKLQVSLKSYKNKWFPGETSPLCSIIDKI